MKEIHVTMKNTGKFSRPSTRKLLRWRNYDRDQGWVPGAADYQYKPGKFIVV